MPTMQSSQNDSLNLKDLTFTYRQIMDGINIAVVPKLLDKGILQKTDIHLAIPPRTLQRRLKNKQDLSVDEADAIARLVRLTLQAIKVFGDLETATIWLRNPNDALLGNTPMHLAQTDAGAREAEAVLERFARGDYD